MFRKFKVPHRNSAAVNRRAARVGESRALITMTVRDDTDFLSPYSVNAEEMISSEVAGFLSWSAQAFHPRTPISLQINSDCIDDQEKLVYCKAIRNYFDLQLVANRRDMRRNALMASAMLLVGIAGLASMFIAENLGIRQLWVECIDIFAWVFIWEAVDLFFIERGRLRLERQRLEAFMTMEIDYKSVDNPNESFTRKERMTH